MNVLFLTEGGKGIGFGHITRSIALYQAFEQRGMTAKIIVNGDNSILGLLKDKDYLIFDWLKEEKRLLELSKNSEITIIDSYLADKSLYDKISRVCYRSLLVMIDDYRRIEYPRGIVLNPSLYGDTFNYSRKDGSVYLLGKDYIILRADFLDIPAKTINREMRNILVTFSGINYSDLAHKMIDYLKNKFNFDFYIVRPKRDMFDSKEMLDLMLKSDICISGGGQTTFELARCGTPTIGICFSDNQLLNLNTGADKGFLIFADWYYHKSLFNKIEESLKKLNYERRVKMSQTGRKFVDGQGARRVVCETLKYKGML